MAIDPYEGVDGAAARALFNDLSMVAAEPCMGSGVGPLASMLRPTHPWARGRAMQIGPNHNDRGELACGAGAMVIDFAAAKAARREVRTDRAACLAAAALARVESGRASWSELAAALVAPFNA